MPCGDVVARLLHCPRWADGDGFERPCKDLSDGLRAGKVQVDGASRGTRKGMSGKQGGAGCV